jgi:hypothetical protein
MNIADYLEMLVKAYNPNQYSKLVERPVRDYVVFITLTTLLALIIFTAIIVPVTLNYVQSIPARTADVEQLELKADVKAAQPVMLMEQPKVTLDLDANGTRSGSLTLTDEGILYPKYLFFGTAQLPWSDVNDLKQQTPVRDRMLAGIIIFLLPSIIFWIFVFGLILCAALFLLFVILGYLAPKLFKHRLSFSESCKMATVAMPSALIFSIALSPLGAAALIWGGFALSIILFTVGVAILSEMDVEEREYTKHK